MSNKPKRVNIFYSYAHEDESYRDELEKHLVLLERDGLIHNWHDRRISPGTDWMKEIDKHIESANIVLLLISSGFMASEYCYNIEMKRAIELSNLKKTRVIPILIRSADWKKAPFSNLQVLPDNAKPVSEWGNQDAAFQNIAQGIRVVVKELQNEIVPINKSIIDDRRLNEPEEMDTEYFKFIFLIGRFSRFPNTHGFDRTLLDWMHRIVKHDTIPFHASETIRTEGGFETAAITTILFTRLFNQLDLKFTFLFKDSLTNFLRKRRDFSGNFGPIGLGTRSGESPIMSTPRHTALGTLALSYLSNDQDELRKSLNALVQNLNQNKQLASQNILHDTNALMLVASLDALYYKLGNNQQDFLVFWEEQRNTIYEETLTNWRHAIANHKNYYEALRSFSYGNFLGMLDYVVIISLFLLDIHIPDDEKIPEFYLNLHGEHCTHLLNDPSNKESVPFLNHNNWKKDGPDLGLSTVILALLTRELGRNHQRGFFKNIRHPIDQKAELFRNFILRNYSSPYTIPGIYTYSISSTLLTGFELLNNSQGKEIKHWIEQNSIDSDNLEKLDDAEIFSRLQSELNQDKNRLRSIESTIINRLGTSSLEGTRRWYDKNANIYANANAGTPQTPKVDNQKANEFIELMLEQFGKNGNLNILELGCGPGQYSRYLAQELHNVSKNYHIIGIDYSLEMINIARSMTSKWEQHTGLKGFLDFYQMDLSALQFPAGFFHGVFAMAPLAHIPKSRVSNVLEDFSYIVRNDGVVFINFVLNHQTNVGRERFWELYFLDEQSITIQNIEENGVEEIDRLIYECEKFKIKKRDLTIRSPEGEPELNNSWYGLYLRKE